MILSNPIFQKYFPAGTYRPINIPNSLVPFLEGKTLADMPMTGFKNGSFPSAGQMAVDTTGPLRILHPSIFDEGNVEETFSIVVKDGYCLVCFQSSLLTNFRNTEAMLKGVVIDKDTQLPKIDPDTQLPKLFPIPIMCPEQIFKMGCADVHRDHLNYNNVMYVIVSAIRPKFVKAATLGFESGFKKDEWNSKSKAAMFRACLGSTMNQAAFEVLQILNKYAQMVSNDYAPPGHNLRIVEANPRDSLWGVGIGCMEALTRLKAQALLTPSAKLFDMADSIFAGAENHLGDVILDVMHLIKGRTFEQHQELMGGFVFFNVEA